MNKILLFLVVFIGFVSCSKDDPKIENNNISLSKVSTDRNNIGVGQSIRLSVDELKTSDVVTYKWTVKDAEGKSEDFVVYVPMLNYSVKTVGKHEVSLNVSWGEKKGSTTGEFSTKECDFGSAVFGNTRSVIVDAKKIALQYPQTGLSGYYWPFDSSRPNDVVWFRDGNVYENYLFTDDKFVAGTKEVYDVNALTSTNGVNRFYAYSHFDSFAVAEGNKIFGKQATINIEWRSSVTESQKINYETKYTTKYDGYGVALYNRDISKLTAYWSDSEKEADAILIGDSKYKIQFIVRKK